jgi:hypothetical protein
VFVHPFKQRGNVFVHYLFVLFGIFYIIRGSIGGAIMDKIAMYKDYIYKQAAMGTGYDMSQIPIPYDQYSMMQTPMMISPNDVLKSLIINKVINKVPFGRQITEPERTVDHNGMDIFDRVLHDDDQRYNRI